MALGDGTAWDETTPTNSDNASDIDDYNRDLRKGIRIRMEYEHATFAGSSVGGRHTYITFQQQASKPTLTSPQVSALYSKDDGASDQDLYFEREDGTEIQLTDGTEVNLPKLPLDYRREMYVKQASTTTISVQPGVLEVNNVKVSKTAATTMTITTAGDWAGGSSLQATDTTGYVGVDSSGNIKLHTTAPTHSDFGVSITAGTKRYATWSGTVYRIIGWFRMNATGSGELDAYGVSNIADGTVKNVVYRSFNDVVSTGSATIPRDNTIPQNTEGGELMALGVVLTNTLNRVKITIQAFFSADGNIQHVGALFQDSTANALMAGSQGATANRGESLNMIHEMDVGTVSFTEFKYRMGGASAEIIYLNGDSTGTRLFGDIPKSFIRIEELDTQRG